MTNTISHNENSSQASSEKNIFVPYILNAPGILMADQAIPGNAKFLFMMIQSLSNKYGYCFATNRELAKSIGVYIRSVPRLLEKLENSGYIERRNNGDVFYPERHIYISDKFKKINTPPMSQVTPPHVTNDIHKKITKEENKEELKRSAQNRSSAPKFHDINFSFEKQGFENITQKDREAWKKAYPDIDLEKEIAKATEWVLSNPGRRKRLWRKFITGWFSRSDEKSYMQKASGHIKNPKASEEIKEERSKVNKLYQVYQGFMEDLRDPAILNKGALVVEENCIQHQPSGMRFKKTIENFKKVLEEYCGLQDHQIERIMTWRKL